MAKNIEKIAAGLGAEVIGQVPDTGGGAFGAARHHRRDPYASVGNACRVSQRNDSQ